MRKLLAVLGLMLAAGCGGTTLKVVGYPEADVFVTIPPGAPTYTIIGRTAGTDECVYVYKLPSQLENTKVGVLVKSKEGAWKYNVFTDRDVTVHYPPPDWVPPVAAQPMKGGKAPPAPSKSAPSTATASAPPATPASPAAPEPATPDPAPPSGEEPSATVPPD